MVSIVSKKSKRFSSELIVGIVVLIFFSCLLVPFLHISQSQTAPDVSESSLRALTKTADTGDLSVASVAVSPLFASSPCCKMAKEQSLSFFNDVPDTDWLLKKQIYNSVQPNFQTNPKLLSKQMSSPVEFWNNNFEPEFTCGFQQRLGGKPSLGDGGKWVCDVHRIQSDHGCVVYSIGSNGNAMFEKAIHDTMSDHCKELQIHTFDLKGWNKRNGSFKDRVSEAGGVFHEWGLTVDDMNFTREEYFLPKVYRGLTFKTFRQTFEELGHKERVIDVMKIDCEGCEWQSVNGWLRDWKESGVIVRQLLLEIHDSPPEAIDFFKTLKEAGYVIFHKEVTGSCAEYAFLKMDPSFFLL